MTKNSMGKGKGKNRHITHFYMETLLLGLVLIAVILVLTKTFAFSRNMSSQAQILTQAVHLAENAAEAVSASDGLDTLQGLLEENGNVRVEPGEGVLRAWYDEEMRPAADGSFRVEVTWNPEESSAGILAESRVSVYWMDEGEPVYTLETAVYIHTGEVL